MSTRLIAGVMHRPQPQIVRGIQRLVSKRVLIPVDDTKLRGRGRTYRLNENHHSWIGDNEKSSVAEGDNKKLSETHRKVITSDNEKLAKMVLKPDQQSVLGVLKKTIKERFKEKECRLPKGATSSEKNSSYIRFKDQAFRFWEARYGRPPFWGKPEWRCLHQAFLRLKDAEEAGRRWNVFLLDDALYYRGHNPKKFIAELDRWVLCSTGMEKGHGRQRGVGRQRGTAGQVDALEGLETKIQV